MSPRTELCTIQHSMVVKMRWLARAFLCFTALILSLLIVEIAIRQWIFFNNIGVIPTLNQIWYQTMYYYHLRQEITEQHINANTFNIYYFGDSTMQGMPFNNTIPLLVSTMLGNEVNHKKLRWINVAEGGKDFEYNDRIVHWIISHKNSTYPSLIVIYAGHNEFLKYGVGWGFSISQRYGRYENWLIDHSRTAELIAQGLKLYKLGLEDRSYFDTPLVTPQLYTQVIRSYDQKVSDLISYLRQNRMPVIISTVASNYADFEPNRSVFCGKESEKTTFKQLMDKGSQNEQESNYEEAIAYYEQALTICNSFAETYYRLGKSYQALQKYNEARQAYNLALDYDQYPTRATTIQNDFITSLHQDSIVRVVDAVSLLQEKSPDGLIGYNFMLDSVHPNLQGYVYISEFITKTVQQMNHIDAGQVKRLSVSEATNLLIPNTATWTRALLNYSDFMIRVSTWRYDPTLRLQKTEEYVDQTIALNPNGSDGYLYKMLIMYFRKNIHLADIYFQKAKQIDMTKTSRFLSSPWVQQIIIRSSLTP